MKQNLITVAGALAIGIMLFIPLPTIMVNILFGIDAAAIIICGIAALIQRIKGKHLLWLPRFVLYWCVCTVSIVISAVRIILTSTEPDFPALIFSKNTSNKNLVLSSLIFLIITAVMFIELGTGKKRLKEVWENVKNRGIKEEIEFYGNLDGCFKFLSGTFTFIIFMTIIIFLGRSLVDNTQFNIAMNVAARKNLILAMEISIIIQCLFSLCGYICFGCVDFAEENKTQGV